MNRREKSLAVLVGLLAALVPTLGWIGACWAVLGAETVQCLALTLARQSLASGGVAPTRAAPAREGLPDAAL